MSRSYSPVELQFYTSAAALCVQIPVWIVLHNVMGASPPPTAVVGSGAGSVASAAVAHHPVPTVIHAGFWSMGLVIFFALDGVAYHLQSVCVYTVMSFISPVTVSVANTLKRAILIFLSVLVFKNDVTFSSGFGTVVTFAGVLWYNDVRTKEAKKEAESAQ